MTAKKGDRVSHTIRMPRPLHVQASKLSETTKTSINDIMVKGIEKYLAELNGTPVLHDVTQVTPRQADVYINTITDAIIRRIETKSNMPSLPARPNIIQSKRDELKERRPKVNPILWNQVRSTAKSQGKHLWVCVDEMIQDWLSRNKSK